MIYNSVSTKTQSSFSIGISSSVIPAQAGIQESGTFFITESMRYLDSRFHGNDKEGLPFHKPQEVSALTVWDIYNCPAML